MQIKYSIEFYGSIIPKESEKGINMFASKDDAIRSALNRIYCYLYSMATDAEDGYDISKSRVDISENRCSAFISYDRNNDEKDFVLGYRIHRIKFDGKITEYRGFSICQYGIDYFVIDDNKCILSKDNDIIKCLIFIDTLK